MQLNHNYVALVKNYENIDITKIEGDLVNHLLILLFQNATYYMILYDMLHFEKGGVSCIS